MTGQDLFGVCVRVVGLILVVLGMWNTLYGVRYLLWKPSEETFPAGDYLSTGLGSLTIGTCLILGAQSIVQLAY